MSTPAPGRRVAARRRSRPTRGGVAAAGIMVLSLLLLAAGGLLQASPDAPPQPTSVAVEQVTAACLGWPESSSSATSTLVTPLPEGAPDTEGGELTTALAGEKAQQEAVGERGALLALDSPGRGEALAVAATGAAAVGRATFQSDRADGAGVAMQECPEPRSRWWFTGGGAGLDHQSRLVLANLDPGPAVVDVLVQGPDGLADDVGTRGVTLSPGQVRTIDLVDVAPQADELGVLVDASRGRVVAGLADAFATRPAADPGREWVPGQSEAARVLRLTPLPRLADQRTLVLANPSPDREALVEVRISGQSGSFVPTGLEAVRVPAQSVVTEDIGDAVAQDASAVLLRSPVPLAATVRSARAGDVSYAAAGPLLDGPAAAVLPSGLDPEVHVTAGPDAVRATITAYSEDGDELGSSDLKVPASATASWRPRGRASYVVVTPVQGRLSGGVAVSGGDGLSQVTLRPLPISLRQPVVVPVVR